MDEKVMGSFFWNQHSLSPCTVFSPCVLSSALLTFIVIYCLYLWPLSEDLDWNVLKSKIFSNSTCLQPRGLLSTQLYYIPVFPIFVNNTTNSQSPKWVTLLILKPLPHHNNSHSITCQLFQIFSLPCYLCPFHSFHITIPTQPRSLSDFCCATCYHTLSTGLPLPISHFFSLIMTLVL